MECSGRWSNEQRHEVQYSYSITSVLHCSMRHCRVSPGECGFTSSDGDPGTNGVISKLAAEQVIKAILPLLQADLVGHDVRARRSALPSHCSTISPDCALADPDLFGKCVANAFPISRIASTSASENLSLRKCSRIRSTICRQ